MSDIKFKLSYSEQLELYDNGKIKRKIIDYLELCPNVIKNNKLTFCFTIESIYTFLFENNKNHFIYHYELINKIKEYLNNNYIKDVNGNYYL